MVSEIHHIVYQNGAFASESVTIYENNIALTRDSKVIFGNIYDNCLFFLWEKWRKSSEINCYLKWQKCAKIGTSAYLVSLVFTQGSILENTNWNSKTVVQVQKLIRLSAW